jgi:hypothetical protein
MRVMWVETVAFPLAGSGQVLVLVDLP